MRAGLLVPVPGEPAFPVNKISLFLSEDTACDVGQIAKRACRVSLKRLNCRNNSENEDALDLLATPFIAGDGAVFRNTR